MRNFLQLMVFIFLATSTALAQGPTVNSSDNLPLVFVLGEHAEQYDAMTEQYSNMLLDECKGDMQSAYSKWMGMLKEMEAYAKEINYDIDGIQIWMNVFWNKDGSVKHIAYYLKPESKVVPLDELTAFIKSFAKQYKFPVLAQNQYVHYGHAFFPTTPKRVAHK
ncbi:MAG TPA: hypothetical protein ENK85_02445 [Saprospiraceae bacterium]|nr:hypothetical protein [Saprospiraceae bacterium]